MKQGEVIAGYRITTAPTNANGGKCIWAFAEKSGSAYFIKQFLEPKRPKDDARESPSLRVRRQIAHEFEERHRTIMKRLRPDAHGGGNLVLATDFFHEGSTYYKVTERIDTSSLEKPQALEPRQKMVLLKTLGTSLKLLHDIDVVHGDLKPLNVLVQKRDDAAFHAAKLIDFDDSYVAGNPPSPEEISGDSAYGAPEWRRYLQQDASASPEQLTCSVDVFALGLMTHLYLTGELPRHDARFDSPADAVAAGERLRLDPRLSDEVHGLLRAMTQANPKQRPRMATYLKALSDPKVCALQHRRPGSAALKGASKKGSPTSGGSVSAGSSTAGSTPEDKSSAPEARTSRVRSSLKPRTAGSASASRPTPTKPAPVRDLPEPDPMPEPAAPSAPRPSRVRINLGDRSRDRNTP